MPRLPIAAGLIGAALLVAACGASSTPKPATPAPTGAPTATPAAASQAPAGAASVTIAGFAFNPPTITVSVGTTVTWSNQDSATHTVTFSDGSTSSGRLAQGGQFQRSFDKAGTFTYACSIHSSMTGTVVVQP